MSRKKVIKKSNILRLKLELEELRIAEEENAIGYQNLQDLLKHFSKKVKKEQRENFNKQFFDTPDIDNSKPSSEKTLTTLKPEEEVNKDSKTKLVNNNLDWVKKLYKKIVMRSHPDKFIDFPIKEIRDKFIRVYMDAVSALQTGDVGMMLLCAHEVEIDIGEYNIEPYIQDSIKKNIEQIKKTKDLIGYQWYHTPDDSTRLLFLENYLRQLGYDFNKEKAEDFIKNSNIKRKVGTRPKRTKRVNLKRSK